MRPMICNCPPWLGGILMSSRVREAHLQLTLLVGSDSDDNHGA